VKKINEFKVSVDIPRSKREINKKQFLEFVKNFAGYEKENMMCYADNNENAVIFNKPSDKNLNIIRQLKNQCVIAK
jgi:hypothetical protein